MDPTQLSEKITSSETLLAGRYRLLEELGKGGMGCVYKALHVPLNKIVALKMMSVAASDETSLKRFKAEAQLAYELNHENLGRVTDFGVLPDGKPFLVMDYIEGNTLAQEIVEHGPLDPDRARKLFVQLCAGLEYAHRSGMIHRDLKPSNVMLEKLPDGTEVAKIVDFGLARANNATTQLTKTGEIFGSPVYMSPEQCQGGLVDGRTDLYSLGCIMFEVLSGRPAWQGETAIAVAFQKLNGKAPELRTVVPNAVPSDLSAIADRLLEREPEKRFPDVVALREALVAGSYRKPKSVGLSQRAGLFFVILALVVAGGLFTAPFARLFLLEHQIASSSDRQNKLTLSLQLAAEQQKLGKYDDAMKTLLEAKSRIGEMSADQLISYMKQAEDLAHARGRLASARLCDDSIIHRADLLDELARERRNKEESELISQSTEDFASAFGESFFRDIWIIIRANDCAFFADFDKALQAANELPAQDLPALPILNQVAFWSVRAGALEASGDLKGAVFAAAKQVELVNANPQTFNARQRADSKIRLDAFRIEEAAHSH